MLRRLFDPNDNTWTAEAGSIEREVTAALTPIVERLVAEEVDMRDLQCVLESVIVGVIGAGLVTTRRRGRTNR